MPPRCHPVIDMRTQCRRCRHCPALGEPPHPVVPIPMCDATGDISAKGELRDGNPLLLAYHRVETIRPRHRR